MLYLKIRNLLDGACFEYLLGMTRRASAPNAWLMLHSVTAQDEITILINMLRTTIELHKARRLTLHSLMAQRSSKKTITLLSGVQPVFHWSYYASEWCNNVSCLSQIFQLHSFGTRCPGKRSSPNAAVLVHTAHRASDFSFTVRSKFSCWPP